MSEKHYYGDVGEVEYVRLESPNMSTETYYSKEYVEKLQQRITELEEQLNNNEQACLICYKDQEIQELKSKIEKDFTLGEFLKMKEQLENAIVPKFKVGQEVWFVYDENDDFNYTILNKKVMAYNYFSYEGGYFEYAMSDDGTRDTIWYGYISEKFVFTTKEEALAKLKELKGE